MEMTKITSETKSQLADEFDVWYFTTFNCYPSSDVFNWFYLKYREKIDEMNGNQFRAFLNWQDERTQLENRIKELTQYISDNK